MDNKTINQELNKINQEIKKTTENTEELLRKDYLLLKYKDYNEKDRVISFEEFYKELKEQPQQIGITTGIPKLDRLTEGFREGNLIVVSGTTGMGKTTILQTFLKNFNKKEISTLFFTYEVTPKEFLSRFSDDMPKVAYIPHQHKDTKIVWIEQRILEGMVKFNVKVVMIDHLHYLLDMAVVARSNSSLVIGGLVRQLKELAIKHKIVIFLIAHTKKVKFEEDELPDLNSIRDSGMVAAEADYVLFVDRKKTEDKSNYSDKTGLYVAKNRWNGATGGVPLQFIDGRFIERIKENEETINPENIF